MGRRSKGPCLECLSSYDGGTSTGREGFPARTFRGGSTSGTLWASFRQDLMSCRPLYQKLWYDFHQISVKILATTLLNFGRAVCRVRASDDDDPK